MKKLPLVGRLPESAILNEALQTKEAEMIAIGRPGYSLGQIQYPPVLHGDWRNSTLSQRSQAGESPAQVIDQSCFSATGLLRDEFNNLYPALFRNATLHTSIVRTLFQEKSGMTRQRAHQQVPYHIGWQYDHCAGRTGTVRLR
jgi:hypothetical protein